MNLIEGKVVSAKVLDDIKSEVESIKKTNNKVPGLAVIIIGEDPASQVYVRNKVKRASEVGMYSEKYELPSNATQEEVLDLINKLNEDSNINGLLVQSPPPSQINERALIEAISPQKDIDCFHPYNVGKLLIGDEDGFLPCTPAGVIELLKFYNIETSGKHAVVVGRSNIVGKPMSALLMRKGKGANCTVTVCHSGTRDLVSVCKQADILISAIGKANFITEDMVKNGAVVIDVGINRIEDSSKKSGYRLVGDVDFNAVSPKTSYITPVPGGVGVMTIAMLLKNTLTAFKLQNNLS